MKFYASKIDQLIEQIKTHKIKAVLLYGPNKGLVTKILLKISESLDLRINEISAKDISESNFLNQLLNNQNLFRQREICKINHISDSFNVNLIKEYFVTAWHIPILIADEPSFNSKLKKFCETETYIAAIGCYNEDNQSIAMLCSKYFQGKKTISLDAIEYLSQNLSGDSLIIQNELEKILYYNFDASHIDIDQVKPIVNSNLLINYDQLCIYFLAGNAAEFVKEFDKIELLGASPIILIRILNRYLTNLLIVNIRIESGENIIEAMNKLSVPIFYKYINGFKKLLLKYNSIQIIKILKLIQQSEVTAKLNLLECDIFQIFLLLHRNL